MQTEMCCRCCDVAYTNRATPGMKTRQCYGRRCPCWVDKHGCETCTEECVNKQDKWDKKKEDKAPEIKKTEDKKK